MIALTSQYFAGNCFLGDQGHRITKVDKNTPSLIKMNMPECYCIIIGTTSTLIGIYAVLPECGHPQCLADASLHVYRQNIHDPSS